MWISGGAGAFSPGRTTCPACELMSKHRSQTLSLEQPMPGIFPGQSCVSGEGHGTAGLRDMREPFCPNHPSL